MFLEVTLLPASTPCNGAPKPASSAQQTLAADIIRKVVTPLEIRAAAMRLLTRNLALGAIKVSTCLNAGDDGQMHCKMTCCTDEPSKNAWTAPACAIWPLVDALLSQPGHQLIDGSIGLGACQDAHGRWLHSSD